MGMCRDVKTIVDFYIDYDEDSQMERNPLEYIRRKEIISRYLSGDNLFTNFRKRQVFRKIM